MLRMILWIVILIVLAIGLIVGCILATSYKYVIMGLLGLKLITEASDRTLDAFANPDVPYDPKWKYEYLKKHH